MLEIEHKGKFHMFLTRSQDNHNAKKSQEKRLANVFLPFFVFCEDFVFELYYIVFV